uniref:BUB1 N-terminal domain-containing protein n=1 Tax=Panagrellus redivivus TaxID=6233 RepID=A0A7E4UUI4_PANRE
MSEAPRPSESRPTDWLDNVENIRPSRTGLSAAAVIAAGNANNEAAITIEAAQAKFTEAFAIADTTKDPLEMMMIYFRWFKDNFPAYRADVLQPMLYQVVTSYGTLPRYKNDDRIMKLWLQMADNFPERGFAVMELAFSRGSCRGIAKFFIAWARMYEYADQYSRSKDILNLGIESHATPLPDLHDALDALEVRQMVRIAQRDAAGLEDDDDEEIEHDADGGRQAFAGITIIHEGERRFRAPVNRGTSFSETPRFPIPMPLNATPAASHGNGFTPYADEMTTPAMSRRTAIPRNQPAPSNDNDDFEIFSEETEGATPRLEEDPDYMSIFGFHYMKERPKMRIFDAENLVPRKQLGENGIISKMPKPDEDLPSFEVYVETVKPKLKFAVRKTIAMGLSTEENMLKIIEGKMAATC